MSTTEAFGDLHYVFCSCVVQTFKCTPTHKGHLRVEPVFSQHHFVLQTLIFFHQGLKRRISVPGCVHFLKTFNTTSSFRIKKKSLLVQILQQDFGSFVVADAAEL